MNEFKLIPDGYYPMRQDLYGALERYLNRGIMPGGFLTAVLENDLKGAFGRADQDNAANLRNIVGYCYHHIPSSSWGSRAAVEQWVMQFQDKEAI